MLNFLRQKERPDPIYRISILSPCNVKPWDAKTARSFDPGAEVDVEIEVRDELVSNGRAVALGRVGADGTLIDRKTPPPVSKFTPDPFPAKWEALPACFKAAFERANEFRALKAAERGAWLALQQASSDLAIDELDRTDAYRILKAAHHAAHNKLARFDRDAAQRELYECGVATVSEYGAANQLRDELEATARSIFSARIEPLGLAPTKINYLFLGSALHQKYVLTPLTVGGIKMAHGCAHYLDLPFGVMADRLLNARRFKASVLELLPKARAEREAATAVFPAPTAKRRAA